MRFCHNGTGCCSGLNNCAIFFLSVILGALIWGIWRYEQIPSDSKKISIMIDAGSVHTSVYAYSFNASKRGILKEIFNCEISGQQGISSVKSEELEEFIFKSGCVQRLFNVTHGEGQIVIGGTAGMRELQEKNPQKANKTMEILQKLVNEYGGKGSMAKILSSRDEGIYGWLTVNYLINGANIHEDNEVGSLDWGGGSSEITFATSKNSSDVQHSNLFQDPNLSIFTRSDECFGQSAALQRYYTHLVKDNYEKHEGNLSMPILAPCQPGNGPQFPIDPDFIMESSCVELVKGHESFQTYLTELKNQGKSLKLLGTANVTECQKEIRRLFDKSECLATFKNHCFSPLDDELSHPEKFYAFSTYFYTSSMLRLSRDVPLNLTQSWSHAQSLCQNNYSKHPLSHQGNEVVQNGCFRGIFMNVLIQDGYGLSDANIKIVNKVKGQDAGWTLGCAYEQAQKFDTRK